MLLHHIHKYEKEDDHLMYECRADMSSGCLFFCRSRNLVRKGGLILHVNRATIALASMLRYRWILPNLKTILNLDIWPG